MDRNSGNPFVLPGFGQSGEIGQNPLLASMEMMRQAWESLAGQGGFGASAMAPSLSEDELARRISDLRAVENWLRMNLAVLSNTIQGMEVQRATIATLKTFAASAAGAGPASQAASPLEVVLGMRPDAAASSAGHAPAAEEKPADGAAAFDAAAATEATQAWWSLLQEQFNTLAAATTATMQGVAASVAPAEEAGKKSAPKEAAARRTKAAAAPAKKTARKTPGAGARKTAKTGKPARH
ncbi:PhaM family polyhydroxyalkanoate granule multifunctional regulatory protein [Paracandidimonas soli]|uniref:Uncharacterized protein n=1 Tax=Paracandidimonas soli TaxID=1917182 RepID=A0A4R3VG70_9BURK|nr:PhaM family polyhydroxyalkanoate granule multifunctional regulatory protein [Paracandidimonas soli]TCV02792.1 hypothetical protein EV686_101249 [Paracandidimonas soli]